MLSKGNLMKYLIMMLIILQPVFGEEEEDGSIIGEIVVDLMVGAFIAVCETSATCNSFMNIVAALFVVVFLIGCCVNGPGECRTKDVRRGATVYAGYRLARR